MIPIIITPDGLSITLKGRPVSLAKDDGRYEAVLAAIRENKSEDEVLAVLEAERLRLEQAAAKLAEQQAREAALQFDDAQSITESVSITVKGGLVLVNGKKAPHTIAERMLVALRDGFDLRPMARFLENLYKNPSMRAVQHLYAFLEHGKCSITEDGCFLVYKAVRNDWTDIRTGTLNNAIGQIVQVPRNEVDEDPDQTCSYGLHVCSFDYLPHFAHSNGHVIVCKVNPADVVAIPRDYANTKMRVCCYEVVGEYEGYYQKERADVLGGMSVASGAKDPARYPFQIQVYRASEEDPEAQNPAQEEPQDRLSVAAAVCEKLLEDSDVRLVVVVNATTGNEILRQENENFLPFGDDDLILDAEPDPCFEVRVYPVGPSGHFKLEDSFDDFFSAKACAVDVEEPYLKVEVFDVISGRVRLTLTP